MAAAPRAVAATVGLLHPGAMGAALGRALAAGGARVLWTPEGRSKASLERAREAGLEAVGLEELCRRASVVFSVCPPASAEAVAAEVQAKGFAGIYVDANAVSPSTSARIADIVAAARYVDGALIGPPPSRPGTTRLYLSGKAAPEVAVLFADPVLSAVTLPGVLTAASSLKMAYAAWTKGSSALLFNVRALAESGGVAAALEAEWALSQEGLAAKCARECALNGPKAWRFQGEMDEIADTFAAAGLPDAFHRGASEVCARLGPLKGRESTPPTEAEVVSLLCGSKKRKVAEGGDAAGERAG